LRSNLIAKDPQQPMLKELFAKFSSLISSKKKAIIPLQVPAYLRQLALESRMTVVFDFSLVFPGTTLIFNDNT
jgi:hypothetical protein